MDWLKNFNNSSGVRQAFSETRTNPRLHYSVRLNTRSLHEYFSQQLTASWCCWPPWAELSHKSFMYFLCMTECIYKTHQTIVSTLSRWISVELATTQTWIWVHFPCHLRGVYFYRSAHHGGALLLADAMHRWAACSPQYVYQRAVKERLLGKGGTRNPDPGGGDDPVSQGRRTEAAPQPCITVLSLTCLSKAMN